MEPPREKSDAGIDSPPPAERRYTFGALAPRSSEKGDFGLLAPPSPDPEDESGKHTLYSAGPEQYFYMHGHYSRASTQLRNAAPTLPVFKGEMHFRHGRPALLVSRSGETYFRHGHPALLVSRSGETYFRLGRPALPISRAGSAEIYFRHRCHALPIPRGRLYSQHRYLAFPFARAQAGFRNGCHTLPFSGERA